MIDEYSFLGLTPFDDVDLKGYSEAFDFIFESDDICNIAITGDYGIGKSSLIRSYEKTNDSKDFLYISLMHIDYNKDGRGSFFSEPNEKNEKNEQGHDLTLSTNYSNKEISDSVIERKLINQLIQSVPCDKIPYTSFSVKQNISNKGQIILSFISSLFLGALIYTFNYKSIVYVENRWLHSTNNKLNVAIIKILMNMRTQWCLIVFMLLFLTYVLYKVFKWISYRAGSFRNIAISTNNMEMKLNGDNKDNESYFDAHLDDILYMFESIKADAVVFEDIERFNNYKVFEQLREINNLVNKRISNHSRKKFFSGRFKKIVRFFYLVHDNMFSDTEMVKFFDFIIPVIPALHVKDSYIKLSNLLAKHNIDDDLLRILSGKIYDYNILKKLINEFEIMRIRFNTYDEANNELLAVIIYKNLIPSDYSDFIRGKGLLFEIVNTDPWIEKAISNLGINEEDKNIKREKYMNYLIMDLIESDIIPRSKLDDLSNHVSDKSAFEIIEYLLENNYINKNIFQYISQYKNDSTIDDFNNC